MRSGLTTFILMLCMCWQALAHAGIAVVMANAQEQEHALLHFQAQGHHHDDDGGVSRVHQDQSPASAQHLASDCGVHAPALVTLVDLRLPQLPPAMLVPSAAPMPPPPCLAGPKRPPRIPS